MGPSSEARSLTNAQKNKLLRLAAELGVKTAIEPRPAPASSGETPAQRAARELAAAAGAQLVEAYRAQLAHHFARISAPFEESQVADFVGSKAAQFKK